MSRLMVSGDVEIGVPISIPTASQRAQNAQASAPNPKFVNEDAAQ
jgi:hypothetical protein